MGLLDRSWEGADVWKVVVRAVILGFLSGPQDLHRLYGIPSLRPTAVEITAHNGCLFPVPAGADPEAKAAAGEVVQGCDLLR
jgi:hypothetical protein